MKSVLALWPFGAAFCSVSLSCRWRIRAFGLRRRTFRRRAALALESAVVASPKLMDEEDLDFDNLDFDAMGEPTNSAAPSPVTKLSVIRPVEKAPEAPAPLGAIKTKTLTDNLQANADSSSGRSGHSLPSTDETWISKLKSPLGSITADESENGASDSAPQKGKNQSGEFSWKIQKDCPPFNASALIISGAMLRMSFQQVDDILTRRGYRRTMQKLDVPNFIRWRNEDQCRVHQALSVMNGWKLRAAKSQKDGHQHVERAMYSKFKTVKR